MVKKIYTEEQRKILLRNKNVVKLGIGVIEYTKEFKIKAVKLYQEKYMTPRDIFIQAGFDLEIIGKRKPKDCLERWNKIFRKKGLKGLSELKVGGGGRPKGTKNLSEKDKIKRMKLEIEYLKEKNRFLAKLRAKKKLN